MITLTRLHFGKYKTNNVSLHSNKYQKLTSKSTYTAIHRSSYKLFHLRMIISQREQLSTFPVAWSSKTHEVSTTMFTPPFPIDLLFSPIPRFYSWNPVTCQSGWKAFFCYKSPKKFAYIPITLQLFGSFKHSSTVCLTHMKVYLKFTALTTLAGQ